jgi:hypothetical protein
MTDNRIILKVFLPLAAAGAAIAGGLLFAFHHPSGEQLVRVEMASPAQMRQAMARLQDDHESINRFLERKQSEVEAKDAAAAKALDDARDEAVNEARRKAEAAAAAVAAQEAALKAAAQRKAAEAAQAKLAAAKPEMPKPELRKDKPEETLAQMPAGNPLPITPVVQPKRGPIDRAIATANELTDRTLAAADAVRSFFVSTAGRLIGSRPSSNPSSNLTSSW